jgi:hypothetical protein
MTVFQSLLEETRKAHHSYDGGDTGFLNSLFQAAWYGRSKVDQNEDGNSSLVRLGGKELTCGRLSYGYNA